nr:MAG TPA: hypothetical protein [Caudoviricetes sp.]
MAAHSRAGRDAERLAAQGRKLNLRVLAREPPALRDLRRTAP